MQNGQEEITFAQHGCRNSRAKMFPYVTKFIMSNSTSMCSVTEGIYENIDNVYQAIRFCPLLDYK